MNSSSLLQPVIPSCPALAKPLGHSIFSSRILQSVRGAAAASILVCAGAAGVTAAVSAEAVSAEDRKWDNIIGEPAVMPAPDEHWFAARGNNISYLVDGDTGTVMGTLTLSMFTPAIRPHLETGRIFSYGSYYSRTYYGERTDVVLTYDSKSLKPVSEVIIPAKSAGIGHSGMIGLINNRFIGVWNITPAMSVSIVDIDEQKFIGEISTAGCAAVYPIAAGFLMPCGDGTLRYIELGTDGRETRRVASESFFSIDEDPIYDYAVPTATGWLFVTLDGVVYEAGWDGTSITVSKPWKILTDEDLEQEWRIGGRQPFAYNAPTNMLVTLMHKGGGQETFEDAGTEVWAFSTKSKRRGYRLKLPVEAGEEPLKASGVQLTADAEPLLIISPDNDKTLRIYDAVTGSLKTSMPEMGVRMMQNLLGTR